MRMQICLKIGDIRLLNRPYAEVSMYHEDDDLFFRLRDLRPLMYCHLSLRLQLSKPMLKCDSAYIMLEITDTRVLNGTY